MPKKLLLSLSLTPLTDRFLCVIFGVTLTAAKVAQKMDHDDIYAFDEEQSDADVKLDQKRYSVMSLILMFKSCMVLAIYVYSTWTKDYRETNMKHDDEEGLTKVIDSMMKKIV